MKALMLPPRFRTAAALLPLAGFLGSCAGLHAGTAGASSVPAAPAPAVTDDVHACVQACMAQDSPALLLRAERVGERRFSRRDADLDPVYLVPCRVLVSHRMEPQAGASVLLCVPAGRAGKEAQEAENCRYWLVAGEGMEPPVRLSADRSVYLLNGLDFYAWNASILLQAPHRLHGVWSIMADAMAE